MALTKEKIRIYKEALDKWGEDAQLNMVVEELGELIVAIQHARRLKWEKVASIEDVTDEVADVEIMLEQLKYMLKIDSFSLFIIKEKKLNRVKELLRKEG